MSDLFHEAVPDAYVSEVAHVMLLGYWHVFQVLTKRAERLRTSLQTHLREVAMAPHVWWGVSVEDRKHGLPRIGQLQASDVAIRFLSIEPLLEDVGDLDLSGIAWVIVGGESGPRARPMNEQWVERILAQCLEQDVPFFFKQWGGTRKKRTGRLLHGEVYDNMPRQYVGDAAFDAG